MTITIEVNGTRVEAETEKDARKALRKAMAAEKKANAERDARYKLARLRAESAAYRVLERKAIDKEFLKAWEYMGHGAKWAHSLFRMVDGSNGRSHMINAHDANDWVLYDHYGYTIIGAVCNGAGFCWLVFIGDNAYPENPPVCMAVGADGDTLALADCPGIQIEDFHNSKE